MAMTAATVQIREPTGSTGLPGGCPRRGKRHQTHQNPALPGNGGKRTGALQRLPDIAQVVHGMFMDFHGLRPGRRHHLKHSAGK